MRYTEKGIIGNKKKKTSNFIIQLLEKLILGLFLIATIGIATNIIYFKDEKVVNFDSNNTQQAQPEYTPTKSRNKDYLHQAMINSADTINKPVSNYIDNYVLKEMREDIEKKTQIQEQQRTKQKEKIAEISSPIRKDADTWNECPPYQREGYDSSNAVILCKNGKNIILPIER